MADSRALTLHSSSSGQQEQLTVFKDPREDDPETRIAKARSSTPVAPTALASAPGRHYARA